MSGAPWRPIAWSEILQHFFIRLLFSSKYGHGHIKRLPEIGDCCSTETLGKDGPLGHGECALHLASLRHRQEPDGESMRADDIDILELDVVLCAKLLDSLGEYLSELDIDLGEFFGCLISARRSGIGTRKNWPRARTHGPSLLTVLFSRIIRRARVLIH
jgi:hypothetical protein